MNDTPHILVRPHVDIAPEEARDVRARSWAFVFQCLQEKQRAAHLGGPDDAKDLRIRKREETDR